MILDLWFSIYDSLFMILDSCYSNKNMNLQKR